MTINDRSGRITPPVHNVTSAGPAMASSSAKGTITTAAAASVSASIRACPTRSPRATAVENSGIMA